ncbi:hypothetical protein AYO38_03855 [bacterium SCGC AG-212-C10]|nr:hypothetical protein AYO38_03855 [bacterium SCGC AG-212-C10]
MGWRILHGVFVAAVCAFFAACSAGASSSPPSPPAELAAASIQPALARSAGSAPPAATPTATATPRAKPPILVGAAVPTIAAAAILVQDVDSGASLFALNEHARLAPASLTKIATAVVVLESGIDLEKVVDVHPDLERQWLEDSAVMGLLPGDQFSIRELLYGLLLASGNDAARELAVAIAGDEATFVGRMNALAARLNLADTHFTDVHGLGSPQHYTSAADLATLSTYAMALPVFREIVGTETHTTVGSQELFLYNLNPLLNYTPGVDGIKVGYTEEAGPTFVASVTRDGHRILVILLNAPSMAFDAIKLIEWVYANFQWSAPP